MKEDRAVRRLWARRRREGLEVGEVSPTETTWVDRAGPSPSAPQKGSPREKVQAQVMGNNAARYSPMKSHNYPKKNELKKLNRAILLPGCRPTF